MKNQIEVLGVWDSGRVESDRSVAIPYGGPALQSGKSYQWRVRVWDGQGTASPWSETSRWTMGKLHAGDWSARWIGAPEVSAKTNEPKRPAALTRHPQEK